MRHEDQNGLYPGMIQHKISNPAHSAGTVYASSNFELPSIAHEEKQVSPDEFLAKWYCVKCYDEQLSLFFEVPHSFVCSRCDHSHH